MNTWILRKVDGGETTTFIAWPEHGCFVEQGKSPEDVGALFAPMLVDGTMDPDVGEIEVAWSDA